MNTSTYEWPGGLLSFAGGTRNQINLDRPWQPTIIPSSPCVFCLPRDKAHILENHDNWLVLQNDFTPYSFHRLMIPDRCWNDNDLRLLGGENQIHSAFELVNQQIEHSSGPLLVTVHIGAQAGQNLSHLHWHVVAYLPKDSPDTANQWRQLLQDKYPQLLFRQTSQLMLGIAGLRAGQCQIIPQAESVDLSPLDLVSEIATLTALYENKLQGPNGLGPDFNLSLRFFDDGRFSNGILTPILNHWGGSEQIALYTPGVPITLPWPHETTVAHLTAK